MGRICVQLFIKILKELSVYQQNINIKNRIFINGHDFSKGNYLSHRVVLIINAILGKFQYPL